MSFAQLLTLLAAATSVPSAVAQIKRMPVNALLHAPWTPFTASGALNLSVIPALAASAAADGVSVVWLAGGMGQFDSMTLAERMLLAEAWIPACKANNLYSVVHVGATAQGDSIALAKHANAHGADAIGSVPPYYNKPSDASGVAAWLAPVAAAAPDQAFYYYHIPGSTGVTVSMVALFPEMLKAIPNFGGVKYVSPDVSDFFSLTTLYGDRDDLALLFAPEPKLAGVALGARGVVLAESWFAPTWLRMCHHVLEGNWDAARTEQNWKLNIANIFGSFQGDAERAVYRATINVDIGPPRLPSVGLKESDYPLLISRLTAAGFFNQTVPGPCVLPRAKRM